MASVSDPNIAHTRSSSSSSKTTTTTTPTSTADELEAVKEAMMSRGITNPEELLGFATPDAILGACRWHDAQKGVGPGLLAKEIRAGGKPGWHPEKPLLRREAEYGELVVAWLRKHFPEYDRPTWGPHPAAVAAVVRLHHERGRGNLRRSVHGPTIRAAVARFREEYE